MINRGFIEGCLMIILGFVFFILVVGMCIDFSMYSKLYDAKTPEEIKKICQDDWYQNTHVRDLPAKCSTIKAY